MICMIVHFRITGFLRQFFFHRLTGLPGVVSTIIIGNGNALPFADNGLGITVCKRQQPYCDAGNKSKGSARHESEVRKKTLQLPIFREGGITEGYTTAGECSLSCFYVNPDKMRFKEFLIRPATNSDVPAIQKIVFSTLAEHGLHSDPGGKDKDLDDIEKSYLSGNGFFGVAINTETNHIVGTFGLFPQAEKICELRKMYLSKESRGKGLGKFILDSAVQIAKEKHYTKIILETISPLRAAISLYKKYGFKEIEPIEINDRVDQAFELDIDM